MAKKRLQSETMNYFVASYEAVDPHHKEVSTFTRLFATNKERMCYISGDLSNPMPYEFLENPHILKTYGKGLDNSGDMYDKFLKDYPISPDQPSENAIGFVSPDGTLYTCEYGGHSNLASDLYFTLYTPAGQERDYDSEQDELIKLGWVDVHWGHLVGAGHITKPQADTLTTLLDVCSDVVYKIGIKKFLEVYKDDVK